MPPDPRRATTSYGPSRLPGLSKRDDYAAARLFTGARCGGKFVVRVRWACQVGPRPFDDVFSAPREAPAPVRRRGCAVHARFARVARPDRPASDRFKTDRERFSTDKDRFPPFMD